MKVILFFSLIMLHLTSLAQTGLSEVSTALKNGNAKGISPYFHPSIDLTVLQKEGTFSKTQAEQIIQDFFTNYKPTNYKSNHTGSSGDGSKYIIGTLETAKGNFRVYLLYKNIASKELIQTFRIENNN